MKSSAPSLTYSSPNILKKGTVVTVPLKTTLKDAVVIEKVVKPEFETAEITSVSDHAYSQEQMEIAKFICEYYFSSLGEALSLFIPFKLSSATESSSKSIEKNMLPRLSDIQKNAYDQLLKKEKALLFGVTGSGKTEIFISLMAKMLEEGKSAIFLMPEISLTPQMEKRLKVYFGERVAMWHSKLTKKKKESILEGIERGEIRIVAGARSALFVPLSNLGLIIVDEEHDDSYKAMTRPRYHARDVAVLMGSRLGAKVVLASATPSMSSYYKYDVVKLDKPYVQTEKRYKFISGDRINHTMLDAIDMHYKAGDQSLLFLPTRGNFKYLYCESCGKTHLCPFCSVGMALHRKYRHLKCHYCNYTEPIRDTCTHCGHTPLKSERMGTVEAIEVISEAVEGIQIEQFDKDSITTAKKLKEALKRFESGESQLLLGTQMLSKGHDYANITLSIIMGLDYILGLADYRARERATSLLFQIAGRSGRAKAAQIIVQTGDPEFFQTYLADYELFIKDELAFLEMAEYPPFASLARILIAHKDETKASKITLDTVTKLKAFEEVEIVGHGKAPVEKIANKFRFHILLRSKHRVPLLKALHSVDRREIEIDFDPVEFS
ncbi:primosomal protein N' [Sulfurovum sp. TSL1]|uniref:primosomal protein N' n=1 Tax=Sulfurovum sp. TSL1 TaxID=2826994 RepID=UPI001EE58694|nr:primosomal protein N' [Sulfurovum sp. TSL1]